MISLRQKPALRDDRGLRDSTVSEAVTAKHNSCANICHLKCYVNKNKDHTTQIS